MDKKIKNFIKNLIRNWPLTLPLITILLTGAYLRLWKISEYLTFLGDEGRDVLIVKRMIVDHDITFLGPTASVGGFFLGPIYYYFMTPFLWLWRLDPTGPAVMVALFGVATIYLIYKTGSDFFNQKAGLAAALLYSISPLVIAYSRSSWNPNLVPFFSLLYIYSLWKSVVTGGKKWYFTAGLSVGIGLQLHYLFSFLVPVGIFFPLLYKKNRHLWQKYAIFLGGWVSGIFPFLAFEIKNRFPNTQTIIRFVFQDGDVSFNLSKAGQTLNDLVFRLFARLIFYFPPPEQLSLFKKNILFWWKISIIGTIILSLCLLFFQIFKRRAKPSALILVWFTFTLIFFLFYQRAIYDYYFGIIFTLPFLLVGNLFSFSWRIKFLKPLAIIGLISLVSLNLYGRPFKSPPNRQLAQVKNIAQFIYKKANNKPFNFALITGGNSDHAYRYFLEIWHNPPVTIENFEKDPERKSVTNQLFVICESSDCKPLGHPLWEISGFGRAEIKNEWEISVVKIYKLVHYKKNN